MVCSIFFVGYLPGCCLPLILARTDFRIDRWKFDIFEEIPNPKNLRAEFFRRIEKSEHALNLNDVQGCESDVQKSILGGLARSAICFSTRSKHGPDGVGLRLHSNNIFFKKVINLTGTS